MSIVNRNEKPIEWEHDLHKGDRAYLREQGVTERDFKRMDPVSQNEWKEECNLGAYETMRNYGKKVTKIFV